MSSHESTAALPSGALPQGLPVAEITPTDPHRSSAAPWREPSIERIPHGAAGAFDPEERTFEMALLWERLRRRRGLIVSLAGATTALAFVAALVLPAWYRASASLLPPNEDESGFGLSSLLKGIGVPGVKVPTQSEPADVFVAILKSRRVNEEIVRRFDLRARYQKRLTVDALKELARHTRFAVDDAGIIALDVEDRDPKRAAEMANAYVSVLDRFNRDIRMTMGRRTRLFVGQRLKDTDDQLVVAEDHFAAYQATHRTPPVSSDVASALGSIAGLYAQREVLQVRLGVIEGYTTGGSDEATQIRSELAQIDRRLSEIPESGIRSLRLLRELKTLEQLKALLTAQYEQARIQEVRDVSTLAPLDVASPPEKRSRPRRSLLVITGLVLGLAAGGALALLERERPRPA